MKTVSIITPVYQERENIISLVPKVDRVISNDINREYEWILVINENDPSRTPSLAVDLSKQYDYVRVFPRQAAPAFGKALIRGIKESSGEIIIIMMGDLSDNPRYILSFQEAIEDGADVVYGSRFTNESKRIGYDWRHLILNRIFNLTAKTLLGLKSNDLSNAFKAYRKSVFDKIQLNELNSKGFVITVELALKAHCHGFSHTEIPVDWRGRENGASRFKYKNEFLPYSRELIKSFYYYYLKTKR